MKCPSCKLELTRVPAGGLKVLVCQEGCGGLWFGHLEMRKLKGTYQGRGERLLDVPRVEGVRFFRDVEAICPQCVTSLLFRHFFSKELGVEVCQCAKCSGFWLDIGELGGIQSRFDTEEVRKQAVASYLKTIFAGKIAKMDLLIEEIMQSARSIVRIFLFICPRKYLPKNPLLPKAYFGDLIVTQDADKHR